MSIVFSNANTSPTIFSRVLDRISYLARAIRSFATYVRKDHKAARAQYPFLEW